MSCAKDVEDIHNVLSVMQKTLECPICLDLMQEPVTTRCDHIFCRFCMLQLLSKKRKGRVQCPMCKKEVTKRSLQESPRFKLLVDGVMKIINAFELDSGYKFFPSQDHARNIFRACKESMKKEDLTVVRSAGFRSRNSKRTGNGGQWEDCTTLLETDKLPTRRTGTESCSRPKRKKQETNNVKCKRPLITDFESDHSENDLLKKANSLGELEEDDSEKSQEEDLKISESISLKPEADEVVASDLAEYGFSERDLESTRSNLLCMESERVFEKNITKKWSSVVQDFILDADCANGNAEQSLLDGLAENTANDHILSTISTILLEKHVHGKNQDDNDESIPDDMASTQSSPKFFSKAIPKKRLKLSIQKVDEWLQKTSEFLNATQWDEELLSEVFPVVDEDLSDKGSCESGETEIVTAFCHNVVSDSSKKMVNVKDKIFGKVYKREKKSNPVPKITVIASVHVDGIVDSRKINEVPNRLTSRLQKEDFIVKADPAIENSNTNDGGTLVEHAPLLETNDLEFNQVSICGNNGKSNAQKTKSETSSKYLSTSEHSLRTQTEESLSILTSSHLTSNKHNPSHAPEIKSDTYPDTNESGYNDYQNNVRRSRRLNRSSKEVLPSAKIITSETSGKVIHNLHQACINPISETVFQEKQLCSIVNKKPVTTISSDEKEKQIRTDVEIHPECEMPLLTDLCSNVENIDSEMDTEHLMKAFKSAKRTSFKLDSIAENDRKEHLHPLNLSDTKTNVENGFRAGMTLKVSDKPEESFHPNNAILHNDGGEATKPKGLLSSGNPVENSVESTDIPILYEHEIIVNSGQLDETNSVEETKTQNHSYQERNSVVSKSDLDLCPEDDTSRLCLISTHQSSSSPVRHENISSAVTQGENEQVKKDYWKQSFNEEQVNQITFLNRSQGSVRQKLLEHSVSHNSSPLKSPEVYSDTPEGLLCIDDRCEEEHSFCAKAEKSFVFAKDPNSGISDRFPSPVNDSQLLQSKKRKAQKLESSEEESSEDEELPCFNTFLFGNAPRFSPKQQGGGALAMFSSCSTSGKTATSLNFPKETLGSQESVNLFSSQSNTSDHSTHVAVEQELQHKQPSCQEKKSEVKEDTIFINGQEQEDCEIADNNCEDACKENYLDEDTELESEASHTSGLSSQCDVFNTQQRNALRNNLEKLQEEMAALEAVLEQHSAHSPSPKKDQPSTAEHNTNKRQEASKKQADHEAGIAPNSGTETMMQDPRSFDQPVRHGMSSRSPTPPPNPPQANLRKKKETISSTSILLKTLNGSVCTQEKSNNLERSAECNPSPKPTDTCKLLTPLNRVTTSPRRRLRSKAQNNREIGRISTLRSSSSAETNRQSQQKTQNGDIKRSTSPVFTSPIRGTRGSSSSKIPVIPNRRNFSLVASGLSQSELMLVQKFARKTQSTFTGEMSDSTTHVIIKTDEYLVCERTLKYFLGIAGRKWVVSFEWIVQSFREGRILDEYDFEVKGDVINGRNHRGPRRSRLGSDELLLSDFEICCLGSFRDMTKENLEWMVSLCGAYVVKEPQMFKHKEGITSLLIVQPDGKTDYAAMRKQYHALVVTREWVLDSVASYKLQTFDSYLI